MYITQERLVIFDFQVKFSDETKMHRNFLSHRVLKKISLFKGRISELLHAQDNW